jgi:hypothetical protein
MPTEHSQYKAIARDSNPTAGDQTGRKSRVPPALAQLFERPASEQPPPNPLDIFPPADWPPCPDCAGRLMATAVATDAQETLAAAAMTCYNRDHVSKRYIYDVSTETVYFEQVRGGPETQPPGG